MLTAVARCLAVILVGVGFLQTAGAQTPNAGSSPAGPPAPGAPYRALMGRYCFTCHNETLKTAGLVLSAVDADNPVAGAEVWEKVIRKLRTRGMPPAGLPRPAEAEYDAFAAYLETEIDRAAAAR